MLSGQRRRKIILRRRAKVNEPRVLPERIRRARVARHHVRVHVHGINRVGHGDRVAVAEDVENVAHIALGPIGNENLVRGDLTPASLKNILGDRLAQKLIPLLRPIPAKRLPPRKLIHRNMHRRHTSPRQRLGHIPDPHADDLRL